MSTVTSCSICHCDMEEFSNPFFDMQASLIYLDGKVRQYVCTGCGHGLITHDIPLELLYNTSVALPVEYVDGDIRFRFIESNLDLDSVNGTIVEFGGGPGELAEQARKVFGRPRATVVDFVNRLASDTLDFVQLDFDSQAERIPALFADFKADRNLFLLSHVIEHLHDPLKLLQALKGFSDSVLFIEVPDFGGHHDISAVKFSLNHLEHIHYFTSRSLLKLLDNAGYTVLAMEMQALPRMPSLRVLCAPARVGHNALLDYRDHFSAIAGRFTAAIAAAGPDDEVWIWGLSPFLAQALTELGANRGKIVRIFDTRLQRDDFFGIPVQREPRPDTAPAPGKRHVIICGSIYPAVQKVIKAKAGKAFPAAKFVTILP